MREICAKETITKTQLNIVMNLATGMLQYWRNMEMTPGPLREHMSLKKRGQWQ